MNLPIATIVVNVCELKSKLLLGLLDTSLKQSGARFELYLIVDENTFDVSFLNPKKVFVKTKNTKTTEFLNLILNEKPLNYFVFISEPFLCQMNWLKNLIKFKENIHTCGTAILPLSNHIDNLELSHTLNCDFELSDVYVLKENKYSGIVLFGQETINSIGGFNTYLDINSATTEYMLRGNKNGFPTYASFDFVTPVLDKKIIAIKDTPEIRIEQPIREFSPIEEIAYHHLEAFFEICNLKAEKFMFDFTAVFGFRCMCLEEYQIEELNRFCINYNLSYTIRSYFLPKEQKLNKNIYVIFNLKV